MQGHLDNLGRDLFTVSGHSSVRKDQIKLMGESLLLVLASCKQRQGTSSRNVQGSCKRALEFGPGKGLVLSFLLKLRAMTERFAGPGPAQGLGRKKIIEEATFYVQMFDQYVQMGRCMPNMR